MRVAAGVVSLVLGAVILFQSCAVAGLGTLIEPESGTGFSGMLVGILLMVGGGFAFRLPKVAMVISVLAGLAALMENADFKDMRIWAVVCLGLAVLEFFAARKPKAPNTPTSTAP